MTPAGIAHMEVANDFASLFLAPLDAARIGCLAFTGKDVVREAIPIVVGTGGVDPRLHLGEVVGEPVRHVDAKRVTSGGNRPMQCRAAAVFQPTTKFMFDTLQRLDLV